MKTCRAAKLAAVLTAPMLMAAPSRARAQNRVNDESIRIMFHVTAVKRDTPPDWCQTGQCSATRFTVEGYSKVPGDVNFTKYTLTCVETEPVPPRSGAMTTTCPRLRPNVDYSAKLFADVIDFVDTPTPPDGVTEALFEIELARESVTPQP
jgi:hypothetical protein